MNIETRKYLAVALICVIGVFLPGCGESSSDEAIIPYADSGGESSEISSPGGAGELTPEEKKALVDQMWENEVRKEIEEDARKAYEQYLVEERKKSEYDSGLPFD